ncbi:hypothetical protein SAMN05216548_10726 [Faunimonas pinastri]|uniref:Uncharacterized protein n=1 Tax=Faunimonas pinastri TaxID=1855383 RepID=A0A1H9I8V7_9HYPH|nr:hypothetical protein [Faunimonas pinastri]SEQ71171.1 hypothetical protein SAMN05216548_10726 [Faunimonas pinastri]
MRRVLRWITQQLRRRVASHHLAGNDNACWHVAEGFPLPTEEEEREIARMFAGFTS